ncbi:hypothetical protein Fcan01_19327 [Folsomia candida]|uniref:Uncharacterized protein n=1 Tax=Folsomia candida TaxID=158441 RepID=A0A226DPW0_FOLCA|nr:hypothetical protein Fcan01_19327 [Folsomia candida]
MKFLFMDLVFYVLLWFSMITEGKMFSFSQFFNSVPNCYATFHVKHDNLDESNLVFHKLHFSLPVLIKSLSLSKPPQLPKYQRYAGSRHNSGCCMAEYVLDPDHILGKIKAKIILQLMEFGTSRRSVSTLLKFLILVIPPVSTPWYIRILTTDVIDASIQAFLVRDEVQEEEIGGSTNQLMYFSTKSPLRNKIVLDVQTADLPEILDKLVHQEKRSVYNFVHSADLDAFTKNSMTLLSTKSETPVASGPLVAAHLRKLSDQEIFDFAHFSRASTALKTFSLMQILAFVLLEDIVKRGDFNSSPNWRDGFTFSTPRLSALNKYVESGNVFVVWYDSLEYNFLTCDAVQTRIKYDFYHSPFDTWSWICMIASLLAIWVGVSRPFRAYRVLHNLLDLIGVTVEKPILIAGTLSRRQVALICVWIWAGIILNTGWKANFTTEMITPISPTSPLTAFWDLSNFTFYSPVPQAQYYLIENPGMGYPFTQAYSIFQNLINSKVPKILELAKNALTLSNDEGYVNLVPLAYKFPAYFWGNMTTPSCKGKAYMDKAERIDDILPFANRLGGRKTGLSFTKGKKPLSFCMNGWIWSIGGDSRLAEGLVERQSGLLAAGIYSYWIGFYTRFKPVKLFQHFDESENGNYMNVLSNKDEPKALGLDSNILSVKILFSGMCAFCVGVAVMEWCYFRLGKRPTKYKFPYVYTK